MNELSCLSPDLLSLPKYPMHGYMGLRERAFSLYAPSLDSPCGAIAIHDPKPDAIFGGTSSKMVALIPLSCSIRRGGKTAAKEEVKMYRSYYPEIIQFLLGN